MPIDSSNNRVAIVGGVRTPFVKAGGVFAKYSMQDLGAHVLASLVKRYNIDASKLDEVIFGTVLLDPRTPNWAREIVFKAGLPKSVYAHSVSNNCISGLVAITDVAERIALGRTKIGIAGGTESMSSPALLYSKRGAKIFTEVMREKRLIGKLGKFAKLRPGDLVPDAPSPKEPSTGLTMGEHMEITAKELKVSRESQDEVAYQSHLKAHQAASIHAQLIEPLGDVKIDNLVRKDTSLEKLSHLRPVFDRSPQGTITAGNSSALTDGASAVLLMSESRAQSEGRKIHAYLGDYEYSAIDSNDGLLMAPAVCVPKLLERNKLRLEDFDLIEVHEAFGAQVVANILAWENGWKLPAVGKVAKDKLNVNGGSIALGHPFAATGGRLVAALAMELERRNLRRGLISICAAGAMAGAVIVER